MTIKCYRTNTDFDLAVFLAQEARTPDGKYVFYTAQKNIMEENLANFRAAMLKKKAVFLRAQQHYEDLKNLVQPDSLTKDQALDDQIALLEAEAELTGVTAGYTNDQLNMEAGKRELDSLNALIEAVRPYCKYTHLSLLDQQEAVQQEEWLLELTERAKENLICTGTIPVDQFRAMKAHPEFVTRLVPAIKSFSAMLGGTEFSQLLSLSLSEDPALPPIDKTALLNGVEHHAV